MNRPRQDAARPTRLRNRISGRRVRADDGETAASEFLRQSREGHGRTWPGHSPAAVVLRPVRTGRQYVSVRVLEAG